MNSKNRITYRFDRTGQTINDVSKEAESQQRTASNTVSSQTTARTNSNKQAKMNVVPLYSTNDQHVISEINPWNSPFQEDIGALEQLIRNADTKPEPLTPAPAQSFSPKERMEKPKSSIAEAPPVVVKEREASSRVQHIEIEDEEPEIAETDELEYDDLRRQTFRPSRIKRTSRGPSWFNVFLSVAGALATGALFGYLLLSLFTGATIWPGGSSDQLDSQQATGNAITDVPAGTNSNSNKTEEDVNTLPANETSDKPSNTANIPMISLTGLDQSYYFLQFGVFSNTEGRDAALGQLADQGLAAAAMTTADDYRVYAGMAGDRDKAALIKAQLPGLDLYVKEMTIAAPEQIPFSGDAATAQAFFEKTSSFVQMLDELASAQLEQPSLSSLSESAADAWQKEHQEWTESAAKMRTGTTDTSGKAFLDNIILSINSAAKSLLEYDKKPSRAHLWSTQSAVMEAIITQKQWFETNSAL